jgi:hypothetical protein
MKKSGALLFLLGATGLLLWRGCTSEPLGHDAAGGSDPSENGGAADAAGAGTHAAGTRALTEAGAAGQPQGSPCSTRPPSATVPDGFAPLPLFDCRYNLYVPKTSASLPPPIAWRSCAKVGPDPYACQEMSVDWPTDDPNATGGRPILSVEPDGKVVAQFRRLYFRGGDGMSAAFGIVAEVDGVVRQAVWDDYASSASNPFWFQAAGVSAGRSTWSVFDMGSNPRAYIGLGGDDRALTPPTLFGPGGGEGVPRPGADFYAKASDAISIHDYAGKDFGVAVENGADAAIPAWAGNLMYTTVTGQSSDVYVWSEATGARRLLGSTPGEARAVGSFATDGADMVWLEGGGAGNAPGESAVVQVFRAKANVNPGKLVPTRVRSFPGTRAWSPVAPAVGCGYAAFNAVVAKNGTAISHLFIVKLADGTAWNLRPPDESSVRFNWGAPAAITCDEVFVPMADNLRRLPLASLGAPLPAD